MASSTQPGGRVPAPGELAFVQAFINSHYDLEFEHGVDLFGTPGRLAAWLRERDLLVARESGTLDARDVRRAIRLREALRSIAGANGDPATGAPADALAALDRAARGVAIVVRFTPAGPRFAGGRAAGIERAIGLVVAITARAMIDGSWSRLKVCPGEDCGWAFYDQSRNQSGRWCSMTVCGGRAKARAYYRRRRRAE
jgi:predicted RNA-binding Zn ribbon-like protein